ncbi:MAG: hypothetical protein ABI197_13105 [Granulicella sp.]
MQILELRRSPKETVLRLFVNITAFWLLGSLLLSISVVMAAEVRKMLLHVKLRMVEVDNTIPLPLVDRRKKQLDAFRLRLTRRNLTIEEGRALETLRHATDYLIDTYGLYETVSEHPSVETAPREAVQLLLNHLSDFLDARLPLPSFAYLLQRRISYSLMVAKRH